MNPSTLLDDADVAADRKERLLTTLAELADFGMEMARLTGERAVAAAIAMDAAGALGPERKPGVNAAKATPGETLEELGRVFSGLAGCVQQTIALEAKIAADGFARTVDLAARKSRDRLSYKEILLGTVGSGKLDARFAGLKPGKPGTMN